MLRTSLLILLLSSVAHAAPSIVSVSGTFSGQADDDTANVITIDGTNFGSKSPAAPLVWATFDGASTSPTTLGRITEWTEVQNLSTTTANQPTNSSFAVIGTWNSGASQRSFSFSISDATGWDTLYTYGRRFMSQAYTSNQKFWRAWPNTGSTGTCNFVASTDSDGVALNECDSSNGDRFDTVDLASGTWVIHEAEWTQAGIWRFYENGTTEQSIDSVVNDDVMKSVRMLDNFTDSAHAPADGSTVYMDDLYADDTRARIILGNASTLASSTQREIQIPKTWGATQATAYFHQGAFASEATAYVFIVDPDGSASDGFEITIGAAAASSVPKGTIPIAVVPM